MKRARVPHVGMGAERAHLRRRDAGEPPRPILRIGDVGGRRLERFREAPLLPEDLRTEIEPTGKPRRQRLGEIRAHAIVFGRKLVGPGIFVVEDRQRQPVAVRIARDESAGGAVAGDGNRVDRRFAVQAAKAHRRRNPKASGRRDAGRGRRSSRDWRACDARAQPPRAASTSTTFAFVLPISMMAT